MEILAIVLAVIVGIAVAALLFKPFFGNAEEFFRCVKFYFTPDVFSFFRGEFWDDWWAETKIGFWLGAAGISGTGTYLGLMAVLV